MRVGLVIYGSLETISGGFLYDRLLVRHLRDAGDDVDVIALPWRSYGRHLFDNFSADLTRRLSAGYDILLQDELNHPSLAWSNRRIKHAGIPIVSIVHHLRCLEVRPSWQNSLSRLVERRYLRSVDAFIFNSNTTRSTVEALTGEQRPSLVAMPGGDRFAAQIDADSVAERARERPLRLVFVGNLIPRKGLHVLLEALPLMQDGDWTLDIIGATDVDPGYANRIRSMLASPSVSSRVTLHGRLPDDALAALLASCHVMVVPSDYEGFGIVYLEGMAFGLPAVGTSGGAAGELIDDSVNGFIVPPGDAVALAARLEMPAADRHLLARMSLAALDRFRSHPTWAQTCAAIRAFMLGLL